MAVHFCLIFFPLPSRRPPNIALRSVAKHFLSSVVEGLGDEVRLGVVDVCVEMQELVRRLTETYRVELRRHYYVTPTSYLELIKTFQSLLREKRKDIMRERLRYSSGVEKLLETAESVKEMQEVLRDLQPKLKEATRETEELLKEINKKQVGRATATFYFASHSHCDCFWSYPCSLPLSLPTLVSFCHFNMIPRLLLYPLISFCLASFRNSSLSPTLSVSLFSRSLCISFLPLSLCISFLPPHAHALPPLHHRRRKPTSTKRRWRSRKPSAKSKPERPKP